MSIFSVKKQFFVLMMSIFILLTLSVGTVSAQVNGLNGIGAPENTQEQTNTTVPTQGQEVVPTQEPTGADAMGAIFDNVGVDEEAAQKANEYTRPIAQTANIIFAFLLGLAFIVMFVMTGVDMLYIAFPPIRNLLYKGSSQQSGGGMGMGMGGGFGGGFGGGYGGYGGGMGMGGGQPQQSGFKSIMSQLISDEAVAAVQESQAQSSGGGGGMGMMGGFGGMGMMGGGGAQQETSSKSIIISYLKKRTMFMIAFGVCAALFSTTIFTDIGVSLGTWLLNILMGVNDSIPQ